MFCTNCGSKIVEGHEFCGNCGSYVGKGSAVEPSSVQPQTGEMTLHCPRCGKTGLQVQSNNRIVSSTTMARTVGRRHAIGGTSYNSIAETLWFCSDCGMKFRDLDELLAIARDRKKRVKFLSIFLLVFGIIMFLLGLFFSSLDGGENMLKVVMIIYVAIILIPFGLLGIYIAHDGKKHQPLIIH